jgi:hypothetical protein
VEWDGGVIYRRKNGGKNEGVYGMEGVRSRLVRFRVLCGSGACVARFTQKKYSLLGPSRPLTPSSHRCNKETIFRLFPNKPDAVLVPQQYVAQQLPSFTLVAHDAKNPAPGFFLACSLMLSQQQPEAEATPSPPNSQLRLSHTQPLPRTNHRGTKF